MAKTIDFFAISWQKQKIFLQFQGEKIDFVDIMER